LDQQTAKRINSVWQLMVFEEALTILHRRLVQASLRLAWLLNDALK
jgi:hypothetical protein